MHSVWLMEHEKMREEKQEMMEAKLQIEELKKSLAKYEPMQAEPKVTV